MSIPEQPPASNDERQTAGSRRLDPGVAPRPPAVRNPAASRPDGAHRPAVGEQLPETRQEITREALVRYAGASGDFNPIHWDDDFARSVGLPGVIAHGMYSMGVAARALAAYAGGPAGVKRLKVRFPATIRPDQTLSVRGEVARADGNRVTMRFWAEDEHGERVLSKGEAELELD